MCVVSVACSEVEKADVALLEGRWTIESIVKLDSVKAEHVPYFEVNKADWTFSGMASCNRMFGSVILDTLDNTKFSFAVNTTRMMCRDMSVEQAVVTAMSSVASFVIDAENPNKALFYNVAGGVVMTAVKGEVAPEEQVEGIEGGWNIVSVDGTPTTTAETPTTMTFTMATNTFYGNAGCNGFGGEFVMSDDSLSFANVYVNGSMCSDESMAIEAKVLNALNNTKVWTVENKSLHLKDASGMTLAILNREE